MHLIKFSISNFRSFNKEQSINFGDNSNVSAIFGPNGSGKTNLFRAMIFFRDFIRFSTRYTGQDLVVETFALHNENNDKETKIVSLFSDGDYIYEYGFNIRKHQVSDEFLKKGIAENQLKTVFRRKSIMTGRYAESGFSPDLLSRTRNDSLLLTKAWENNINEAIKIFSFLDHFRIISGTQSTEETSRLVMESPVFKTKVLSFLKNADLYIQDISVDQVNLPEEILNSLPLVPEFKKNINRKGYNVTTTHFVYDQKNGAVVGVRPMSLGGQESNGTQRMYELAFPIIDSMENGNILCIDEFELFLHPHECEYIISLFRNKDINKNNAQLIIMTHATQIMNQVSRRDIYLFGKNAKEETIIGNIPNTIRLDDKLIEKKYLRGHFGSIPNVEGLR